MFYFENPKAPGPKDKPSAAIDVAKGKYFRKIADPPTAFELVCCCNGFNNDAGYWC